MLIFNKNDESQFGQIVPTICHKNGLCVANRTFLVPSLRDNSLFPKKPVFENYIRWKNHSQARNH